MRVSTLINAESTRKLGLGYLDRLNGYASGGIMWGHPQARPMPMGLRLAT